MGICPDGRGVRGAAPSGLAYVPEADVPPLDRSEFMVALLLLLPKDA